MTGLIVEAVLAPASLSTQARSPASSARTAPSSRVPDRICRLRASRRSRTRAVTSRRPCRDAAWRASSRSMTELTWGRARKTPRAAIRTGERPEARVEADLAAGIGVSIGPERASTKLQSRSERHFTTRSKGLSKIRLLNSTSVGLYIHTGTLRRGRPRMGGRERGHQDLTLEEEIRRVDTDITKLKIQFDLYFLGSVPKPPTDQRDALDKQLKKLQLNLKSSGERFLFNSVLNKFNAYTELWLKQLRVKEEGAHLHPLARRHAHQAAASAGVNGGSNGAGAPGAQHAARRRGAQRPAEHAQDESWRIPTNRRDEAALKKL